MSIFCLLCAVVVTAMLSDTLDAADSAASEVIKLWPGNPPGPVREIGPEADITKPEDKLIAGRRIIKLANVTSPEAHVYLPAADNRSGAAVVICPGGGFHILAWDLEGTEVAEWLNSIGIVAVVVKYRVPTASLDPKWLPPVQDAQRAVSIVRSRAADWGLQSDQIGILGFSAGGLTAGRTALATERLYDSIDEVDKQSCQPNASMLIYPAYFTNEDKTGLADDVKVTSESPRMFLVHAFDDPITAESSLFLALALKRAGVPSEIHMYDTGGHGYGLRPVEDKPVTLWPKRCEDWLRRIHWAKQQ